MGASLQTIPVTFQPFTGGYGVKVAAGVLGYP